MIQLEIKIMVIGLRSKSNLLYHDFSTLRLDFLLLTFLLVKELLVIDYLANRRIGRRGNLYQIQAFVFGQTECLLQVHDGRFHIIAYHAHHRRGNAAVNPMFLFFPDGSAETAVLISVAGNSYGSVLLTFCLYYLYSFTSSVTRLAKSSSFMLPKSPSPCLRTETVPSAASFSPTTNI